MQSISLFPAFSRRADFADALKRYATSEHYRPALLYDYAKTFGVLNSFLPYLNTIA